MAMTQVENQRRIRERRRAIVVAAKSVPCMDCGIQYPYWVMQLDHVRGEKLAGINQLVGQGSKVPGGASYAKLLAELEKCDVVCANCHADRTFQRKVWPKPGDTDHLEGR